MPRQGGRPVVDGRRAPLQRLCARSLPRLVAPAQHPLKDLAIERRRGVRCCSCGEDMSDNSKIEWTDATWNPVRGCTKISPGCKHCYAEAFAERFRGVKGHPYEQGFDLRLIPEKLSEPLQWRKPKMVFVNSMSDLFQEGVPDEYIVEVARVMKTATQHVFQVLTKRPERMGELLRGPLKFVSNCWHIWWGVSVEDRAYGLPRIPHLQSTPAAVRF